MTHTESAGEEGGGGGAYLQQVADALVGTGRVCTSHAWSSQPVWRKSGNLTHATSPAPEVYGGFCCCFCRYLPLADNGHRAIFSFVKSSLFPLPGQVSVARCSGVSFHQSGRPGDRLRRVATQYCQALVLSPWRFWPRKGFVFAREEYRREEEISEQSTWPGTF